MDDIVQNKNLGEVAISNDVILSVVEKAIFETEDVAEFSSPKKVKSRLINIGHKGKEEKITIEKDQKNQLTINIPLSIKYGASIKETSEKLQKLIKQELEEKFGIKIKKVNIEVLGIEK